MSQNEAREERQPARNLTDQVCPFLGWYIDAETHHAYPSPANHCHTQEPPLSIDVAHQASTCLGHTWPSCPRYQLAQQQGVIQRPARISWLGHSAGRSRHAWRYGAFALLAVGLVAGLVLLILPQIRPEASSTPTSAVSYRQETAAAESTLAPNSPVPPTASPAATPTPTLPPAHGESSFLGADRRWCCTDTHHDGAGEPYTRGYTQLDGDQHAYGGAAPSHGDPNAQAEALDAHAGADAQARR